MSLSKKQQTIVSDSMFVVTLVPERKWVTTKERKDKLLVFADEAFWAGNKQAEGVLRIGCF